MKDKVNVVRCKDCISFKRYKEVDEIAKDYDIKGKPGICAKFSSFPRLNCTYEEDFCSYAISRDSQRKLFKQLKEIEERVTKDEERANG